MKATDTRSGAIVLKESLIHVSNVALVDPDTSKPTRVFYRKSDEGTLRVAVSSGAVIPKPPPPARKREFNAKSDTPPELVLEETYIPPERVTEPGPLASLYLTPHHTQAYKEYRHIIDYKIVGASEEAAEAAIARAAELPEYVAVEMPPKFGPLRRRRRWPLKEGKQIGYPNKVQEEVSEDNESTSA